MSSKAVPVKFANAFFDVISGEDIMTSGTVYISEPVKLENVGVTLVSIKLSPKDLNGYSSCVVSGYIQSVTEGQNLVGNLGVFEFTDAWLRPGSINILFEVPPIRYEQFTFRPSSMIIDLTNATKLIGLYSGTISMKSPLETLDNTDMEFFPTAIITFNRQGKLSGGGIETRSEQSFQLLVPGGSMLRVESASLKFSDPDALPFEGYPLIDGSIRGRLILPFENPDLFGKGKEVPGEYVKPEHPLKSIMDLLLNFGSGGMSQELIDTLQDSIIHFGETVQKNGLLIVPRDKELQDLCAYVKINLPSGWSGAGFIVQGATISPVNMAERSLPVNVAANSGEASQRKQGIIIKPTSWGVYVDLDRNRSYTSIKGAPNETKENFWVGIVYGGGFLSSKGKTIGGTVTLPKGYVETQSGDAIVFDLAPGEMIYDLNGFSYQTYLYAPGEEGVKAKIGDELGSFPDAWIHDVMVDMYNNKVDLEINMTVAVDFLMGNRVKAKLYTLKEPEEINGVMKKTGTFLCSVAPTLLTDAIVAGYDMRIDGGFFEPDGMRIYGALLIPDLKSDFDVKSADPLEFTDMIIPADRNKTGGNMKYGYAALDTPVNVDFNGYTVEVREVNLEYTRMNVATLTGATVLSDNIPLSTENTDKIVVYARRYSSVLNSKTIPERTSVDYKSSSSILNHTFDECFTVNGTLTPKTSQSGGIISQISNGTTGSGVSNLLYTGISDGNSQYTTLAGGSAQNNERFTEYETAEIAFGFIDALELIPFETAVRFGRDNELERNYFAIGLAYKGAPIEFGFGQIRNIGGVVSYNMNVERDASNHNRFRFPNSPDDVEGYIKNLTPYEGNSTKFAAGFYATMNVEHICEIRRMYFAFENGPIIEAGGDFYVPLNPGAILKEKPDPYTEVGTCVIMYNHPARNFSINVDINFKVIAIEVTGNINMQWNPRLFGIYIGYPEMLTAIVPGFKAGAGFAFQAGKEDSFIAAKMKLNWTYDVNLGIVFLGGFIEGGIEGEYHFAGDHKGDLTLELWLKGGIKGGIWFFGRRNIINFYLGAEGRLTRTASSNKWNLYASCEVGYSVSLFIASIHGSVHCSFDTSF